MKDETDEILRILTSGSLGGRTPAPPPAPPQPEPLDLEAIQVMATNFGEMKNALEAEGFTGKQATKIICTIIRNGS